jgi:hypothetical protein
MEQQHKAKRLAKGESCVLKTTLASGRMENASSKQDNLLSQCADIM